MQPGSSKKTQPEVGQSLEIYTNFFHPQCIIFIDRFRHKTAPKTTGIQNRPTPLYLCPAREAVVILEEHSSVHVI